MSDTYVLLKRTVFLPKGSPGIYEISNLKVDIRNPQISSAEGKTLCRGDADLLLEYKALEDSGDISRSIWQEGGDAPPPTKPWQALLTLAIEALAQGEFSCPPLCQLEAGDIKWYVIAPRALELEFKLFIKEPLPEGEAKVFKEADDTPLKGAGYMERPLYPEAAHKWERDIGQDEPALAPRNLKEKTKPEPIIPKAKYKEPEPKYKELEPIIPPKEVPPAPALPKEDIPRTRPLPEKPLPEVKEPAPIEPPKKVKPIPPPAEPPKEEKPAPCPVEPPEKVKPAPAPVEPPKEEKPAPCPEGPSKKVKPAPCPRELPPRYYDSPPPKKASGFNIRLCRVMPGDDLNTIAQRAGVSPASLAARNKIKGGELAESMYLIIP